MWQREAARALRVPADLLRRLDLRPEQMASAVDLEAEFPLRVPMSYLRRMRRGDPQDPLLLQVLPMQRERLSTPGYGRDPVGDLAAMTVPGVLHKYRGRALLIVTGACPIHCRYCFRRHYPYGGAHAGVRAWEPALEYLASDPSIREVILSGGDPLSLTDDKLATLLTSNSVLYFSLIK